MYGLDIMLLSELIVNWLKEKFKYRKFISHRYGYKSVTIYLGEAMAMIIDDEEAKVITCFGRRYATDPKFFKKLEKDVKGFLKSYSVHREYDNLGPI